jgi:hypothetical protein
MTALLVRNVRPLGGEAADVLRADQRIRIVARDGEFVGRAYKSLSRHLC